MESKQQKQEKKFILLVALVQGLGMLLIHNWVSGLSGTGASHQLIFPLYAMIVSLHLSLMMLANQPRQLLIKLALGFSSVVACCATYIGHVTYAYCKASYRYTGIY